VKQSSLAGALDEPSLLLDDILNEIRDAEIRRRRAEFIAEDPDDDFATPVSARITQDERDAAREHILDLGGNDTESSTCQYAASHAAPPDGG